MYYSCGHSRQCAEVCSTLIASCVSTQGYTTDDDTARLNAAVALYSAASLPAASQAKLRTRRWRGLRGGGGGGGGEVTRWS